MENMNEEQREFQSEIKELILANQPNLESELEEYHLYDISRVVIELEPEVIQPFFRAISSDLSASIFEYLDEEEAEEIIQYLSEDRIVRILENMDLDDAVDLLKYLNKEGLRLLNKIKASKRKEIKKIMAYTENEIGAFMSDSYLTVDVHFTVKQAMVHVTQEAHEVDYISILYVTENRKLIGYLKLKDLIVARAEERIEDIMETRVPKALPLENKETVAQMMQETNESSIPIVNDQDEIQGIITHDDLMDIIATSEEEDYTKFAAIADTDIDIEKSNLKNSVKTRLPWLSILLALSMVTSIILSLFEHHLDINDGALLGSRLAVYLPLILGMAGNTGTQSLAVMIRYLTKNEDIDKKQIRYHLYREMRTGISQGFILGSLIFGMILITTLISKGAIASLDYTYAGVTSGSIFIALSISTTLGALIPLLMTKFHIDPAVASGPFISTVSDIITLSIYYSVSMLILLPLF
ncbi:MAG: magnesium transporter [Bacilli bacterium]|nr:magnesium transporter [Bacilli bacterium]MBN2877097.1 magnesium transporter [Bacilli bacterium]